MSNKIEKLVPDFLTCKRLKDLGYPQDIKFFRWTTGPVEYKANGRVNYNECLIYDYGFMPPDYKPDKSSCAAPTETELFRLLPNYINLDDFGYHLVVWKTESNYQVKYLHRNSTRFLNKQLVGKADKKLANALAKMVIWLVKNNYLDFKNASSS